MQILVQLGCIPSGLEQVIIFQPVLPHRVVGRTTWDHSMYVTPGLSSRRSGDECHQWIGTIGPLLITPFSAFHVQASTNLGFSMPENTLYTSLAVFGSSPTVCVH